MKVAIFTHSQDVPRFEQLMAAVDREISAAEYVMYDSYDDFISEFPRQESQALIVARRGADGMESARNAKIMQPHVPLVWLSDDPGFGVESYRIGCSYFSAEPVTQDLLAAALARCREDSRSENKGLEKWMQWSMEEGK